MTRDAVPMPPLNSWQTIPVPPPTAPFHDGAARRRGERLVQVLGVDVEAVDVVEQAVVRLADDRQRPVRLAGVPLDRGGHERVADDADAVRVRDRDRRREQPGFADPLEAGQLAVAVEPVAASEDRLAPVGAPRGTRR